MLGTQHTTKCDPSTSMAMADLSSSSIVANEAAKNASSVSVPLAAPSATTAARSAASSTTTSTGFDLINHAIRMGSGGQIPPIVSNDDDRSEAANPKNQELLLKTRLIDQKIAASGTSISRVSSASSTVGNFSRVSSTSPTVGTLGSLVGGSNLVRQALGGGGGIVAALQQRHRRPSALDVSEAANLNLQQQLRMYSFLGGGAAAAAAARVPTAIPGDTQIATKAANEFVSSHQQSTCSVATEVQQKQSLDEQNAQQLNPNAFQFPWKLHDMLDRSSSEGSEDVVSWVENGEAFRVHLPDAFVKNVMPRFFKQTKYKSFQRQLNLYGFTRLHNGPNKGGYKHQYFRQGQRTMCQLITRCPIRDSSSAATTMAASIAGDVMTNRLNRMIVEEGKTIKNGANELINSSSAAKGLLHVASCASITSKASSSSLKNKAQQSIDSDAVLLRQQQNAAIMAAHQKHRLDSLTNSLKMLEQARQEHQLQQLQVQQYEAHRLLKMHQQKQIETPLRISYVPDMPLAGTNHSAYPSVASQKLAPPSPVSQLTRLFSTDSPHQILDSSNNSSLQSSEADASLVTPNASNKTLSDMEEKYICFHREFQFPWKLYEMLERTKADYSHLVSWMPGDDCFKVHDADQFVKLVMPRFFKQTKYKSFQRQLNLYGFIRVDMGPNKGGYRHRRFIRGQKDLLSLINRVKIKGNGRPRSDRSNNSALSVDIDCPVNSNNASGKEVKPNSVHDNGTVLPKSENISGIAAILEAIKTKEGKEVTTTKAPIAPVVTSSSSSTNHVQDSAETSSSDNSTIPSTIDVQMKDICDNKNGSGLSWRQSPSESFSDWTIEVIGEEIGERNSDKSSVYHVHRRVLAVGQKKSEFFAKIFKSNVSNNRTRLKLTKRDAAVFPLVLDYVYADIDLDLDPEKAYTLYSLGERLENDSIIQTVTDYYSKNSMTKDNVIEFLEVGKNFKNKTLLEAAILKCSQEIWFMNVEMTSKIDHGLLNRILMIAASVAKNVDVPRYGSPNRSQIIANFISRSATQMTLTPDVFRSLTAKTILPLMEPIAAIKLLGAENLLLNKREENRPPLVGDNDLRERCISSIRKHWAMVQKYLLQSTELSNVMRSLSSEVLFDLLMNDKTLSPGTEHEPII